MLKKALFAAAAVTILAGATMTAPVTAEAAITCKEASKLKYPDDRKMRHDYKKSCKEAWKASEGKAGPLAKFRLRGEA